MKYYQCPKCGKIYEVLFGKKYCDVCHSKLILKQEKEKMVKKVPFSKKIALLCITFTLAIGGITGVSFSPHINISINSPEKVDPIENLLNEAEENYEDGNYDEVLRILSNKKIRENPVYDLNIGVMYAKGLHYNQDTEEAKKYFRRALEKGEAYYSINYLLALTPFNSTYQINNLIKEGAKHGNRYCEKYLQLCYTNAERTCDDPILVDFLKLNDDEQDEILSYLNKNLIGHYEYTVATNYNYYIDIYTGEIVAEVIETEDRYIPTYIDADNCIYLADDIEPIFRKLEQKPLLLRYIENIESNYKDSLKIARRYPVKEKRIRRGKIATRME